MKSSTHLIDTCGLADPLLSRLKVEYKPKWRIGHFSRPVPDGYKASVLANENKLQDDNLRLFYDKVHLITHGDLFDKQRLITIAEMNLGLYNHFLDK
ncbi:hypothetical protein [Candidatus Albibeggiatoa sp. nov. BB20]|uniref:hypothetical protein n=1 Tax=Candidatus Albibeggiatoa sp. nov. BB20 TaxID=3162723 RepID=UPI003365780E